MDFEWDDAKNRANKAKHDLTFEEAKLIFDGPVLSRPDERRDYGELRTLSIGMIYAVVPALFQRGWPIGSKGETTMTISAQRLRHLMNKTDDDIDYSDIPPLDEAFFREAVVVYPDQPKKQMTVRLDADMVDWFKAQGRGYQTRMNAVLRAYYKAHAKTG